jgi:hypothetical protein
VGNQDKESQDGVKWKNKVYMDPANTPHITSHVGLPNVAFRHFVFDAYGKTDKGRDGLPVIGGDQIECVFNPTLARYIEWERQVMANALFDRLDHSQSQNTGREQCLKEAILSGSTESATRGSLQDILDFIDRQAGTTSSKRPTP